MLNSGKLSKSRPPDTSRPSLKNTESASNYITADKYNIFDIGNPVEESLNPRERLTKAYLKYERKFSATPEQ